MKVIAIITILAAAMMCGCQSGPAAGPPAAIRAKADAAAQRENYDLNQFEEPEIKSDTRNGKDGWMFFYEGKMKVPGNHFMVWIDSETEGPLVLHGE